MKTTIIPVSIIEGATEKQIKYKIMEINTKNWIYKRAIKLNKILLNKLRKDLILKKLSKVSNIKKRRQFLKRLSKKRL